MKPNEKSRPPDKKERQPKASRKGAYDRKKRRRRRQRERSSTVGRGVPPESARYSLFKAWRRVGATVAGSVGPRRVLADRARALVARSRRERRAAPRRASNSHSVRSMDRSRRSLRRRVPPPAARSFQKSTDRLSFSFSSIVDRWSLIDRYHRLVGSCRTKGKERERERERKRRRISVRVKVLLPRDRFRFVSFRFVSVAMLVLVAGSMVLVNRVRATIRVSVRSRGSWELRPRVYRIPRTQTSSSRPADSSEKGGCAASLSAGASTQHFFFVFFSFWSLEFFSQSGTLFVSIASFVSFFKVA